MITISMARTLNVVWRSNRQILRLPTRCAYFPSWLQYYVDLTGRRCHTDQHMAGISARQVEFRPNRAQEVLQSAVAEVQSQASGETQPDDAGDPGVDDSHVEVYGGKSSVSLHAVMQSTVPQPISGKVPSHLNMPGGSWSQEQKYLSGSRQGTHPSKQFTTQAGPPSVD